MSPELMKHTFSVRLAGGAKRDVTAFRRAAGGPWTIKPRQSGKKVWRSLGVVGESKDDLALMRKRAVIIIQELTDARFAPAAEETTKPARAAATIGTVLATYIDAIAIETDIKASTAKDNVRRLRLIVREALQIEDDAAVDAQSTSVLTAGLAEKWQDQRIRKTQNRDQVTKARTRRCVDGVINKARSIFTSQALSAYRKAGLVLADLDGFMKVAMKGNWNSNAYVPIDDATIAQMDQAAWKELRASAPAAFLTYLMMLRLGMRNSEVEHAQRDWIETRSAVVMLDGKPQVQPQTFVAITARPGWPGPKNHHDRRVPIAPDVLEQLQALGGERYFLGGDFPTDRYETTHREICAFVRRFLPGIKDDSGGRAKAAYELRKHFGALVASTQGLDRAAEYLGDRRDTVERHYHAWLQTGRARPLHAEELTPQVLAQVA